MENYKVLKSNIKLNSPTLNILVGFFIFVCLTKLFLFYTFVDSSENPIQLIFTALMAVLSFLSVVSVYRQLSSVLKISWFLIVLLFFVSCLIHFNGLEYICNTVSFLGILTVLPYTRFKQNTISLITICLFFYCCLIILFANRFEDSSSSLINLNTNTSSITMLVFEFCLCAIASTCKTTKKAACYALAFAGVAFQFMFDGRSSLIGTAVLIFYILFRKYFNNWRIKSVRNLVVFICVFSAFFAYFYSTVLFEILGHGNVYFFGKDLFTGRQHIWAEAFKSLQENWLFGIGNSLETYMGEGTNLHNQILGYLSLYGVPITVVYIILLANAIAKVYRTNKSNYLIAFLIAILILCYFETALYSLVVMQITVAMIIIYYYDRKV